LFEILPSIVLPDPQGMGAVIGPQIDVYGIALVVSGVKRRGKFGGPGVGF